jgi:hypothetical protein
LTAEHTFVILVGVDRTQVRRRRAALLGFALAITTAFVGGRASAGTDRPASNHVAVVRQGDTLWAIAQRLVGPDGDPRPIVQQLIDVNGLSGGLIRPGDRLQLPSH